MHSYSIFHEGPTPERGRKVLVMVHGRGASAASMLSMQEHLEVEGLSLMLPQATNNTWYPYSFMMPRDQNQPWLDSALGILDRVSEELLAADVDPLDIYWLGFSQGACLVLEFVASHGIVYGGAFGLSGGLIGNEIEPDRYAGKLHGMPIILGCSDVDSHIPLSRVHETERVFQLLGADVRTTIYPDMGHHINDDEMRQVNQVLSGR
jgi:phospholipase/carboxylesterase